MHIAKTLHYLYIADMFCELRRRQRHQKSILGQSEVILNPSQSSEVMSTLLPHLKINLMACSNTGGKFMLLSQNAQLFSYENCKLLDY